MRIAPLMRLAAVATIGFARVAGGQVLTEDFNAPFPAWESGWFGTNSDALNYYCAARGCAQRGNNPTGLWLWGPSTISVAFTPSFGATIASLSLDVSSFQGGNINVYDGVGALIFTQALTTAGAGGPPFPNYNNPGIVVNSANGISGFGFDGPGSSGNLAIDNISVTLASTSTPEPATVALLATGLVAVAGAARRRRA